MNWRPISGWHFLVLLKIMPKGHTEMVSFYWQTWEEVTLKRKLWSFEKFWFYWSWCSKLSGKKKKKKCSKFTETGQANCNAIMQTTSFGFMNKEIVSVWQFLCSSHARKCVDKRRWIFVFYSFEIVWMFDKKIDWDWPSCFFVLEESEVKITQKCFKIFLHKPEYSTIHRYKVWLESGLE